MISWITTNFVRQEEERKEIKAKQKKKTEVKEIRFYTQYRRSRFKILKKKRQKFLQEGSKSENLCTI